MMRDYVPCILVYISSEKQKFGKLSVNAMVCLYFVFLRCSKYIQ